METVWHFRTRVRITTLLSLGLASVLLGLFASGQGLHIRWIFLLTLPVFGIVSLKRSYAAVGAALCIGFLVGGVRGSTVYVQVLRYHRLYGQSAWYTGSVSDDPSYDESRGQTVFHLASLQVGKLQLPGRIQVAARGDFHGLTRGDRILVSGKLFPPLGTSRQGSLAVSNVAVMYHHQSLLETLRSKFFAGVHKALLEPQASIGLGYLIGLRVSIPKEINDQLALVGLTHVVAVSGYNLTIIIQAVRRLLGKRSAYQSVVMSLVLMTVFVAIAGGSAPINRAVVVSTLSLQAWYFGREFKPVLLLILSGAVTAFVSPLYIWGDPGWYLSFLAFAGIIVLAPLLMRVFYGRNTPGMVSAILIETLAAQICTVPYSLYLFGGVSIIAPLANVAILPIIPFIMFTIFLTGTLGMFSPSFASIAALVPGSLITLQLWIIEKLSKISWAHLDFRISAGAMVVMFAAIVGFVVALSRLAKDRPAPNWESDLV